MDTSLCTIMKLNNVMLEGPVKQMKENERREGNTNTNTAQT